MSYKYCLKSFVLFNSNGSHRVNVKGRFIDRIFDFKYFLFYFNWIIVGTCYEENACNFFNKIVFVTALPTTVVAIDLAYCFDDNSITFSTDVDILRLNHEVNATVNIFVFTVSEGKSREGNDTFCYHKQNIQGNNLEFWLSI